MRIDAGSLHEADDERGWAHFLEHMLFKGTETYPDRRAREIWQELGASFGSDSNAQTSPTDTVYILNLPHATRAPLDTSLAVLAEMMMRARIEPAAVAAERPVVLEERGRRPELAVRFQEMSQRIFFPGLLYADRDTIGTEATLNGATAEGLRAFYRRWYRPERTTIVMVGDADPALMEELIRARFGGWRSEGQPPAEPNYGAPGVPAAPAASLVYPGVPTVASLIWIRPYDPAPHTSMRERRHLEERLAAQIVSRRLEAHARGESAFLNAGVGLVRSRNVADWTSLTDHRPERPLARSDARSVRDSGRRAPRSAERGRDRARAEQFAHRHRRGGRGRADRAVADPRQPARRGDRQQCRGRDRRDRARQFRGQCAADDARAGRCGDAASCSPVRGRASSWPRPKRCRAARRRWPRGWRRRGRRRPPRAGQSAA